jgi:hypothetical protein
MISTVSNLSIIRSVTALFNLSISVNIQLNHFEASYVKV